ncbi:MAG: 3-phosphoserine/phosphohydroxythreonine transaminase [Gammaproteobacteria bacterium]
MIRTVYNFSAGPAMLPDVVLERLQAGIKDFYHGMSILEISHRSEPFEALAAQAEIDLREVLKIPDSFEVLFMHGGGRGQFSAVPLNLLGDKNQADYIVTGLWSKEAAKEAKRYTEVNIVADAASTGYQAIPHSSEWLLNPESAYLYYADNETVQGIEFPSPPVVSVPLVSDMTSNLLTRRLDWSRFGCVFAATQKNLGIAGLTVAIVRRDLLNQDRPETPAILNYSVMAESRSLYNTPPVFSWYVTSLMLSWLKEIGGIETLQVRCEANAKKLYDLIDASDFYQNSVDKAFRSRINIPFQVADLDLEQKLLSEAEKNNIWFIKGHKNVGGFRISLYAGMPAAGVDALIAFLKAFERNA